MIQNKRWLLFSLVMLFLIFLVLVFWDFIMANVVLPVAAVTWLFLRIFVLSIDQQVYWWLLIFGALFFAATRLFHGTAPAETTEPPASNFASDRIKYWENAIRTNIHEIGSDHLLKRDLIWMLTSLYSSRRQGSVNFEIKEAMQHHEIPLPGAVYSFLFADEQLEPRPDFLRHPFQFIGWIIQGVQRSLNRWYRKRSGRQASEYFQGIDDVLAMMEDSLEMKYDDNPNQTNNDD